MPTVVVSPSRRGAASAWPVEFVERKGIGHPDTLADGIAEAISGAYSRWCLDEFGAVANHWVDKCMIVGGESEVRFGYGRVISPIRLLVVGKVTSCVGDTVIPFEALAEEAAVRYLTSVLTRMDPKRELVVDFVVNQSTGAGRPGRWYRPKSCDDLTPAAVSANDAVICCSHAPLSPVEQAVLLIERVLNGVDYKQRHPEIGTDIKVLASRVARNVELVLCIPFIADLTPSRSFYDTRKGELIDEVASLAESCLADHVIQVRLNTRDDDEAVYMTALGTAADTGDCGVVGRGNRANGLIAPGRMTSIEAPAGKNPIYHGGKIYAAVSARIADTVAASLERDVYVNIATSTGAPLDAPDIVSVEVEGSALSETDVAHIREVVDDALESVGDVRGRFVASELVLW